MKTATAKPGQRAVRRKRALKSTGLEPSECSIDVTPELAPIADRVECEGGCVVAIYWDPLGGQALLFAVMPLDRIQPRPFQRDLSDAHHKRFGRTDSQDRAISGFGDRRACARQWILDAERLPSAGSDAQT